MGLKMRIKEGNKEEDILKAAVKVFAEFGFHKSKMYKIAETAGIATGSIYLYFENKEAILDKIFLQLWEQLYKEISGLNSRKDLGTIDKIDYLIDIFFDSFSTNPSLAIVFVNEQTNVPHQANEQWIKFHDNFLDAGEEILEEGVTEGIINPNINIKIFRFFLLGGIRSLLDNWAKETKAISIGILRQNTKLIIKKGILNS